MLFARAIGDPNPIYYDPGYAEQTQIGGIIAPPTFVQVQAHYDPEHRMRPRPGVPWVGSGRESSGVLGSTTPRSGGTGLHAEQHFRYHQALRPGDILHSQRSEGKTWTKTGRRGGKLLFADEVVSYTNQRSELVVAVRSVRVRTERPVSA